MTRFRSLHDPHKFWSRDDGEKGGTADNRNRRSQLQQCQRLPRFCRQKQVQVYAVRAPAVQRPKSCSFRPISIGPTPRMLASAPPYFAKLSSLAQPSNVPETARAFEGKFHADKRAHRTKCDTENAKKSRRDRPFLRQTPIFAPHLMLDRPGLPHRAVESVKRVRRHAIERTASVWRGS
jgi:hypothetical protein